MDLENMEMLIEAYEGFMDLERLIDAITGDDVLHTYDDGVFGKLGNIYKVILAYSIYKDKTEDEDTDMFFDGLNSRDMSQHAKAKILMGIN